MTATIIKERERVKEKWYELIFYKKDKSYDGWFGFACSKDGEILTDKITPSALENYNRLENDPEWESYINQRVEFYTENAVAICPHCGKEFELKDEFMSACHCDCGHWYNLFGQELNDPSTWNKGQDW